MSAEVTNTFAPGPTPNTVRATDGKILTAPNGWVLFLPGDAALTRRVKAAGDHWVVQEKKGRKLFSRGVWAPQVRLSEFGMNWKPSDPRKATPSAKWRMRSVVKMFKPSTSKISPERC